MSGRLLVVINFIDFEKAFDSQHRPSLWDIMKAYGIPAEIIRIVQLLYQESECAVLDSSQTSEWFKVETGVKQGCVMSGFLFLLAIDWIMCETTKQANTGIGWRFMYQLEDLDFADNIALISTTQHQMQRRQTRRWRFLGHVLRMPGEHHCATALTWTPMSKRKVGRPKTTWRRTVEKERTMVG